MSSEAIISVEGVGKRYRLGASRSEERYIALRDVVAEAAARPFRALGAKVERCEWIVTFEPSYIISTFSLFKRRLLGLKRCQL